MNLFPVYKQRTDTAVVNKGKFYSTLYVLGFVLTLTGWVFVSVWFGGGSGYVSKIFPENYDPSTEVVVSADKIRELENDPTKKNVKCMCTETDPQLHTFANVTYEQYEFCNYILDHYTLERCMGYPSRDAAIRNGDMCPGGITKD